MYAYWHAVYECFGIRFRRGVVVLDIHRHDGTKACVDAHDVRVLSDHPGESGANRIYDGLK